MTILATLPILTDVSASIDDTKTNPAASEDQLAHTQASTPADRAERLVRERATWAFEHEPELRAILATSLAPDRQSQRNLPRGQDAPQPMDRRLRSAVSPR